MTWRTFTLIFTVMTSNLFADNCPTYKGVSSHAILSEKYPVDDLIYILKGSNTPVFTALVGTFGSKWSNVKKVTDALADRPHVLVVYLLNEAGRRNQRLKTGELYRDKTVNQWNTLLERMGADVENQLWSRITMTNVNIQESTNDKTRVVVIPGLEDEYTRIAWEKLYNLTARYTSDYTLARNPLNKDKSEAPARIKELHNRDALFANTNLCIGNTDGTTVYVEGSRYEPSINQLQAFEYLTGINCQLRVLWHARSQGLDNGWLEPQGRSFRFTAVEKETFRNLLKEANDDEA